MLCPRDSATNKTDTALALRELKHQQGCQTTKPRNKALKGRARGWEALTAPRSRREARVRPKGRGRGRLDPRGPSFSGGCQELRKGLRQEESRNCVG